MMYMLNLNDSETGYSYVILHLDHLSESIDGHLVVQIQP